MKKLNTKKGFTLIELLVVIAIIGILSAVVLAALGSARNKAKDAAVASAISSMRAQAELVGYDNICTAGPTGDNGLMASATSNAAGGAAACTEAAGLWAAHGALNSTVGTNGTHFCADSTGFAGYTTGVSAAGVCAAEYTP